RYRPRRSFRSDHESEPEGLAGEPECVTYCSPLIPALDNTHARTRSRTSGIEEWVISNASSSSFRDEITLYAAYSDVGGQVSSLYPNATCTGTFTRRAKLTVS